jgi:hypothetical protein
MTLAKRLLLGSAAALVATSGAQAADLGLPVAPAVDYVQICSIGSFTGFILPGSDVCFDISGFARWRRLRTIRVTAVLAALQRLMRPLVMSSRRAIPFPTVAAGFTAPAALAAGARRN